VLNVAKVIRPACCNQCTTHESEGTYFSRYEQAISTSSLQSLNLTSAVVLKNNLQTSIRFCSLGIFCLVYRWLVGFSAVPFLLLLVFYPVLPESPRFLMVSLLLACLMHHA
jgi:hypothetical protein